VLFNNAGYRLMTSVSRSDIALHIGYQWAGKGFQFGGLGFMDIQSIYMSTISGELLCNAKPNSGGSSGDQENSIYEQFGIHYSIWFDETVEDRASEPI
jgi:hypothetical protein